MIVLANSDEGVVLQFIDHKNSFSNLCVSKKYYLIFLILIYIMNIY